MNFVEELTWRGMIHDITPGTEEQLQKEMTAAYVGIDPTAESLHIGHLVSVMMLKHFQIAGHKPIALVGGATGMIGDPSGKSEERNLLDESTLRSNQEALKAQISRFLDFDEQRENGALLRLADAAQDILRVPGQGLAERVVIQTHEPFRMFGGRGPHDGAAPVVDGKQGQGTGWHEPLPRHGFVIEFRPNGRDDGVLVVIPSTRCDTGHVAHR